MRGDNESVAKAEAVAGLFCYEPHRAYAPLLSVRVKIGTIVWRKKGSASDGEVFLCNL